ncbi:mitochondrial ribonuclease P protein 1-like [Acanthaster planci]|uniref:RNA (guanine-9-)-methyltransferase domain-containing protein 1 n=1 Tax=Acanthaster planci TaxID=133434 RepID=A0A8B7ZID0_ACAPL|nr:mitochondrial ribonuclease P protein 1-like [Acanthaster planci]
MFLLLWSRRGFMRPTNLFFGRSPKRVDSHLPVLAKKVNLSRQNCLRSMSQQLNKSQLGKHPCRLSQLADCSKTHVCRCSTLNHSELDDALRSRGATTTEDGEIKEKEDTDDGLARIKAAKLEIEVMQSSGSPVPDSINEFDLDYFSALTSKRSRKRFLAFLYKKQMQRLKDKEKRRLAREAKEAEAPKAEEDMDLPLKNRLFLQLQQQSVLQFDHWHLAAGMKFGPKLVYDFSYEEHMRRPEIISLVNQLMLGVSANKLARDPFDIHWMGLQEGSATMREIKRMLGESFNSVMVNITDKQVQDVFPMEDIVYLTADSPNIMRSYDPNKVYIIGALVDSHKILRGVSFAKAKRLDLAHARLPLDLFLKWSSGGKNLTLDQMIQILIELNTSGDWVKALNHVPVRKHTGLKSEQTLEQFDPKNHEQRTFEKSPPQEEVRFAFSRATHSRKWPVLEEPTLSHSKRRSSFSMRQRVRQIIDKEEDDPSNETVFSASGGYRYHQTSSNKDRQWFED